MLTDYSQARRAFAALSSGTCASGYGAPENRVAARRDNKCSAWLVQRHSLRSADPCRRNERQEQSVEGNILILRILALRAHVFKSRCSRSPCCWLHFLDLMRFLSSCTVQLAGTLFRTQKCNQQPTQPRLVYSALGGRKCGRIPRTQPHTGGVPKVRSSRHNGTFKLLVTHQHLQHYAYGWKWYTNTSREAA